MKTEIHYIDANWNPVEESNAIMAEVLHLDDFNKLISTEWIKLKSTK